MTEAPLVLLLAGPGQTEVERSGLDQEDGGHRSLSACHPRHCQSATTLHWSDDLLEI